MYRQSLIILGTVALVGCGKSTSNADAGDVDAGSGDAGSTQCLSGGPAGHVTAFATNVGASEGIAFLNGKLYVGGGMGIREIAIDGTVTPLATLPNSIGMIAWKGALYAVSGDDGVHPYTFCDAGNHGVIYKVTTDGQVSTFATGLGTPNFLVATPWGTLLVSDDCAMNTKIWEVDAQGAVSVWHDGVASPNGMAFNADGTTLFVATTFSNPPALFQISVGADHKAGTATSLHAFAANTTPDGVVLDAAGDVYVALNVAGLVHRLSPDGTDHAFAQGMTTPASLVFGNGPGFDPCSVYATSLYGSDVYRVVVGKSGLPLVQ